MDSNAFRSDAPGRLVQVTGYDRRIVRGLPQAVPVETVAFVPNDLPPSGLDRSRFIGDLSELLIDAQSKVSRLDGMLGSLPNPDLLLKPFRLREAKLSSRIENTFASVQEIALVDAGAAAPRDEVGEVHNYLRALQVGLESDLPLSVRLFQQMHAALLKGVRGEEKQPGKLRGRLVCIGDEEHGFARARFVPPPHGETLERCLGTLEKFLNPDSGYTPAQTPRYPALIELAFAHYQFETIHPFNDGNGRLGRLLIPLSACKIGLLSQPVLYVSGYFEQHRSAYYDLLLGVSTHGDWGAWVAFFLRGVASQAADAVVRAGRLRVLREDYLKLVTTKRASALGSRLVDMLFRRPAVTVQSVCSDLGITPPSAQKHISNLDQHGILREVTGGTYGRIWVASGILAAVEAEEPAPPGTPSDAPPGTT